MLKYLNKFNIIFCAAFFFFLMSSCRNVMIEHFLTYKIECLDCGASPDGLISLELSPSVDKNNELTLIITNNSNETLVFDERFFVISDSGSVINRPMGKDDPNMLDSWSEGVSQTYSKKHNNYYDGYSFFSRYTSSEAHQPYMALPAKSHIDYPVFDYLNALFADSVGYQLTDYYYYIEKLDWDYFRKYMKELDSKSLQLTVTYRLINEDKWRTAGVAMKPNSIIITKREYNFLLEEWEYEFLDR